MRTKSAIRIAARRAVFAMIFAAALIPAGIAAPGAPPREATILGREFYSGLQNAEPIRRDQFLEANLNLVLSGKGYVQSIDSFPRYRRRFRITVIGNQAENLNIIYYLFTDSEDYMKHVSKNDLFEFKGQFVIFTPLSSRRDSYIFDIILEDGAIVVE